MKRYIKSAVESNLEDFEIDENGVLVKYHGNDEHVVIPDGVTKIGDRAFYSSNLKYVEFPDTVREIGNDAFAFSKLVSVKIPDSVEEIEPWSAFGYCDDLVSVELSNKLTVIESNTFTECKSLQFVKLPNNLSIIESGAFSDCTKLKEIKLPNTVTRIAEYAFARCRNLQTINIPDSVEEIYEYAFQGCRNLHDVHVPTNCVVYEYAFPKAALMSQSSKSTNATSTKLPYAKFVEHLEEYGDDSELDEYIWNYLGTTETAVFDSLGIFAEPSTQGGVGVMILYFENDEDRDPIDIDYEEFVDKEYEIATSVSSKAQFKKEFKKYIESLL